MAALSCSAGTGSGVIAFLECNPAQGVGNMGLIGGNRRRLLGEVVGFIELSQVVRIECGEIVESQSEIGIDVEHLFVGRKRSSGALCNVGP